MMENLVCTECGYEFRGEAKDDCCPECDGVAVGVDDAEAPPPSAFDLDDDDDSDNDDDDDDDDVF